MKKSLCLLLLLLLPLCSCMTKNQLLAEQSYYNAMTRMQSHREAQPLVQLIAQDKDKPMVLQNVASLTVAAPPQGENGPRPTQYRHENMATPWLNVLGAALPWFGAWGMVKAVADIPRAGPVTTTTNTNSGNTSAATSTALSNTVTGTGNATNLGSGSANWSQVITEAPVVVIPPVIGQ